MGDFSVVPRFCSPKISYLVGQDTFLNPDPYPYTILSQSLPSYIPDPDPNCNPDPDPNCIPDLKPNPHSVSLTNHFFFNLD